MNRIQLETRNNKLLKILCGYCGAALKINAKRETPVNGSTNNHFISYIPCTCIDFDQKRVVAINFEPRRD